MPDPISPELKNFRRFTVILGIVAVVLALVPYLLGVVQGPGYLGFQYNLDDHMVYSAWMHQAMEGRILFDNRFAVDPQPGLTFHAYFLVLGWVAKVLGIGLAATIARAGFSFLFVWLLSKLVWRVTQETFAAKLAMLIAVFGFGLGFTVWHDFGLQIVKPSGLQGLMLGRLPSDVWQPEGFVFSSMLTNGLFMVSLCLILTVFLCVLSAQESKKHVALGFAAMLVLMNVHSYDVLLIALVLVAFLGAALESKQATGAWVGRAALICLGAIPAALWFVYVLRNDPVFQARAATETYSPNFRQFFFGYFFLIAAALGGWWATVQRPLKLQPLLGWGAGLILVVGMFIQAPSQPDGSFWFVPAIWVVLYLVGFFAASSLAQKNQAMNLLWAWAIIGLIAPYFPALFERKLTMGLSVPWALLAGLGLAALLRKMEGSQRRLVGALAVLICSLSTIFWIKREMSLLAANVSNTTLHKVVLDEDELKIMAVLEQAEGRKVVLAAPGVNSPARTETGEVIPDLFLTPLLTDLNPVAAGMAGAYAYAGHWSETPDYQSRRDASLLFFLETTPEATRLDMIRNIGVTHLIAPKRDAFPPLQTPNGQVRFAELSRLGRILVDGKQFQLIKIGP